MADLPGWHFEKMPEPLTLYDEIHRWSFGDGGDSFFHARGLKRWHAAKLGLRMALRQARRFVLDDDFVRAAVKQASVKPAKMLNLCNLANLPFDKCWFEYSNDVRITAQAAMGTGEPPDGRMGPAGFLAERIEHDNPGMFNVCHSGWIREGHIDQSCAMAPTGFIIDLTGMSPYLNDPFTTRHDGSMASKDTIDRAAKTDEKLRGMGWGYFNQPLASAGGGIEYRCGAELARRGGITLENRLFRTIAEEAVNHEVYEGDAEKYTRPLVEHFKSDVLESRGNLRFYVAVLAMINNVPVQYVHRPAKGFHRARLRNVPYLGSHTVVIHTDKVRVQTIVDRSIKEALGRHNKRHPVRGHWALAEYGHGGRACRHEAVERDGAYALCGRCQKLLVWRDEYERGDASLGYVTHDYEVRR